MGCVLFFQAEDGIRELVRSRGLGDVYKRQQQDSYQQAADTHGKQRQVTTVAPGPCPTATGIPPVSYTHLTLPTSDLV